MVNTVTGIDKEDIIVLISALSCILSLQLILMPKQESEANKSSVYHLDYKHQQVHTLYSSTIAVTYH